MARAIPSTNALQALRRSCRGDSYFASRCNYSNAPWPSRAGSLIVATSPRRDALRSQWCRKTTTSESSSSRGFTRSPSSHRAQASVSRKQQAQETSDPQLNASESFIPDISNYYTLFPKTLPHGPPGLASTVPDSTVLSDQDPSRAEFYINPRELRKEFLQLQAQHHPDKFPAGTTAHQRAYALSTLLNNAYKTLSDPLLRAQYLLQMLYDIDVTSEDNSAHPSDPETLMAVMEAQEQLEEASGAEDGRSTVSELKDSNDERIRQTTRDLGKAFATSDQQRARELAVKLKYWHGLQEALKDWEPGKEFRLTH